MKHYKFSRRIFCCFASGQDGHQGALTCLACNKDGTLVLTGSVDGCAKLINTATGKVGFTESAAGWVDNMHSPSASFCLLKVIGSFSVNGDKEEQDSNSVESVGFCKTCVWKCGF